MPGQVTLITKSLHRAGGPVRARRDEEKYKYI